MSILYPKVNIQEWCKMYNLEITNDPCVKCGVTFPFTIAIAHKDWRGIMQEPHDCGPEYVQSILRPVGENEKEWAKILGGTK